MYSGHMPFGQSVMNDEQIFNAAVSFTKYFYKLAHKHYPMHLYLELQVTI